jgi:MoxR-like ATPase
MQGGLDKAVEDYRANGGDQSLAGQIEKLTAQMADYRKALSELYAGEPTVLTAGKIPEADIVFLDEVFKCNDGVLNSLLTALNERKYTNEGRTYPIPTIFVLQRVK